MDNVSLFFAYLVTCALVTYLVRMLPLVFIRHKITNRYVKSFLYYIPYSVLAVMTVPDMIFSTSYLASGIIGMLVAILLSSFKKTEGLLVVAIGASLAVLLSELLIPVLLPGI